MTAHRLSMSRYPTALSCSYWARSDVACVERPSGREARIGTLVHKAAEEHVKRGSTAATQHLEVERSTGHADAAEVDVAKSVYLGPLSEYLDGQDWTACELGLRYDAATDAATAGPRRGEPGYDDVPAMVLPGTLDLVLVDGDRADVIDLKTGKKQHAHVEQLYAQAVAVSRHYRVRTVRVGFLFARKTKCVEPEWEALDEDRLDEEAGRIARTLRRLPLAEPVRGDWCWYCGARDACPAWQSNAA